VSRGLTVAVLGPDGTGKSTLIRTLSQTAWPAGVRSVYMGFPQSRELSRRLVRFPGGALPVTWLRLAHAAVYRRRGALVLLDRYPYDYLVDDPELRGTSPLSRMHRALLARACPRPDLLVFLDAPADVLVTRRPVHGLDTVDARRHAYLELAERLPSAVIVDAVASADEVAEAVLEHIRTAYAESSR
jgi:thymidylate kinase